MKRVTIFILLLVTTSLFSQVVTWNPDFFTAEDGVVITFNAAEGNQALMGYTGDVYAHTGLVTSESQISPGNPGAWRYVMSDWGENKPKLKLEKVGTDTYTFTVDPSVIDFYVTSEGLSLEPGEEVLKMAFVFRSADGSQVGKTADDEDIFVDVFTSGISAVFTEPQLSSTNGLQKWFPVILGEDETLEIECSAAEIGTTLSSLKLYLDDQFITESSASPFDYNFVASNYTSGPHELILIAESTTQEKDTASFFLVIVPETETADLPAGVRDGINYSDDNTATLVIYAPEKEDIFVIGDFNDWQILPDYQMKKTNDGEYFWVTVSGLTAGEEYGFQYLIDGNLRIADPYTEIVLDPWNDQFIPAENYPDIPAYPDGKSTEIASVLQTAKADYVWEASDYQKPDQSNLIIYEMWLRNFIEDFNYETLIDTLDYLENLGVNAIELMPNNEFEGNESWGYNPTFYFALDKYYGTRNAFKKFVDECHKRDIAVIMDMVLNHSYGPSPLVRMYFENGKPAANNPWYNVTAPHTDNSWGYDFNHTREATKYFVDRINEFWVTEYNIDGIRYDFTGGFTQNTNSGGYDPVRIDLLKRMADNIWAIDPSFYVILEHWTDTNEKKNLVDYGCLVWGESKIEFQEAAMGYHENGKSDLGRMSWVHQSYSKPGIVGYMESHDEERLMVKCLEHGNGAGSYSIKDEASALGRLDLCAAFFFTMPGPKMTWMFTELGFDYSIDFNGRLGLKPFVWTDEFYFNTERKNLYKVFSNLTKLKRDVPAFNTDTYDIDVAGSVKKIHLHHSDMNVVVLGNFDVVNKNVIANFQHTGMWYDYFSGDSINVSNTSIALPIKAGDFNIYTSVKLPTPEQGILLDVEDEKTEMGTPESFGLNQNYPNPFNPATVISYDLPEAANVKITVYNMLGEAVNTLVNNFQNAGYHNVSFNGTGLVSGMYIYRIEAGSFTETRKMVLLK